MSAKTNHCQEISPVIGDRNAVDAIERAPRGVGSIESRFSRIDADLDDDAIPRTEKQRITFVQYCRLGHAHRGRVG